MTGSFRGWMDTESSERSQSYIWVLCLDESHPNHRSRCLASAASLLIEEGWFYAGLWSLLKTSTLQWQSYAGAFAVHTLECCGLVDHCERIYLLKKRWKFVFPRLCKFQSTPVVQERAFSTKFSNDLRTNGKVILVPIEQYRDSRLTSLIEQHGVWGRGDGIRSQCFQRLVDQATHRELT